MPKSANPLRPSQAPPKTRRPRVFTNPPTWSSSSSSGAENPPTPCPLTARDVMSATRSNFTPPKALTASAPSGIILGRPRKRVRVSAGTQTTAPPLRHRRNRSWFRLCSFRGLVLWMTLFFILGILVKVVAVAEIMRIWDIYQEESTISMDRFLTKLPGRDAEEAWTW